MKRFVIGGIAKKDEMMMQIYADVLGRPIDVMKVLGNLKKEALQ